MFFFFTNISSFEIENNSEKLDALKPINGKGSQQKPAVANAAKPIQLPKVANNKPDEISKDDQLVCEYGKNLGLLKVGYTCQGKFRTKCKTMINRQSDKPKRKRNTPHNKNNGTKVNPIKKTTLKARIEKFKKNQAKSGNTSPGAKKTSAKEQKVIKEKKAAEKLKI